jgi:hypothetical protein
MVNQFQASLLTADRVGKADLPMPSALIQAVIGFALVLAVSAFGLFAASHAIGQEVSARTATANVLPQLMISPESLEPNLNGMLATGDGGAALPLEETVGGTSRQAFEHNRTKVPGTSPR